MKRMYVFKKIGIVVFCFILISTTLLILLTSKERAPLPLNDIVKSILSESNIVKSKITELADENRDDFLYLYDSTSYEVSDKELEEYVDELLLSHEKMIEITDRKTVKNGDAIVVSYIVRYNSEIVANVDSEPLMVGSGNYGEEFERAVIGAIVGEPFECELNSPIDTEKYKKGDTLQYNIMVESINYFETYTSSDQYILDYYGVENKQEFFSLCRIRLEKIKKYENKYKSDNDFLDKIADECKFSINKDEAVKYSEKNVEQHKNSAHINGLEMDEYIKKTLKMTEEEFYDFCYDEGVKEIKRYLLVGAYTNKMDFDDELYAEFCTMNGYDSTKKDDLYAKYDFLKANTVIDFNHSVTNDELHKIVFDREQIHTVDVYDSSNIYTIDYSKTSNYVVGKETQELIISGVKNLGFGGTIYWDKNNLYQTVLVVKDENGISARLMIDEINGFVKWQQEDGMVVCQKLDENLRYLINQAKGKSGNDSLS